MKSTHTSFRYVYTGVVLCFVLSGFAALLYQTAWMRQFSLVFGTSELAVAAVLSAYMLGLSVGAGLAARWVGRVRRPVLVYGLLEAGIAGSALLVPVLLAVAHGLLGLLFGGQSEPTAISGLGMAVVYLLVAFAVLGIPTAFMGATLPLLTKHVVHSDAHIGRRVGTLYATNTLGAVCGVLTAGFVLLPRIGLLGTVWVGVLLNLFVFLLAVGIVYMSKRSAGEARRAEAPEHECTEPANLGWSRRHWVLPLMLLSGANSFVYEVLWTRLLGHVLGGSIAAFSTMLAGFLSGIALGSAVGSRFATTRAQASIGLLLCQLGIAALSVLIYQCLPLVIPDAPLVGGNFVFAILVLVPATTCIGATFPLAVRIFAPSPQAAASASAAVYSWNTVGAILGATLAAFFVIPWLQYQGTIKIAVLLNLGLACVVAAAFLPRARLLLVACIAAFIGTGALYQPPMPESILRSSPVKPQPDGELVFHDVGRSATVVVIEENGLFYLRNNGLPEAAATMRGSPPERRSQALLTVYPVLARPDAKNMMVVGLGGGVALESVPNSIEWVDVIELEPKVVAANQFYGQRRVQDPLADPRFHFVINDARSVLSLSNKPYDLIVSQPSHPWTAGASHLYTREYMALAKQRLTEQGVFLQWMNLSFVDEFLLRSLVATMLDVFSHVRVYQPVPGELFLLGSEQPFAIAAQMAQSGRPLADDPYSYLAQGIGSPEDVWMALVLDEAAAAQFAEGAPVSTDNRNYMANRSARVVEDKTMLDPYALYQVVQPFDPLTNPSASTALDEPQVVDYLYISRRLDALGANYRALDLASALYAQSNPYALIVNAVGLQGQGEQDQSQRLLLRALEVAPNNQQARYALLQPWFTQIFDNQPVPNYVQQALAELSGPARYVVTGLAAAHQNDMQTLLDMDAELAATVPTDLWYSSAVKLRVEWRLQLTNPEYQPRMYHEAIALIDSSIAMFLDLSLHLTRIRAAHLAEDDQSYLATANGMLGILESQVALLEARQQSANSNGAAVKLTVLNQLQQVLQHTEFSSVDSTAQKSRLLGWIDELRKRLSEL